MTQHIPVLLNDVLAAMQPKDGEIYVDGTFGAGGYSRALLEAARCKVYAIDRDPDAAEFARALQAQFPGRFIFLAGNFSDMLALLASEGVEKVDGIVLDIGVSSMQVDTAERGFSFRHDAPLDMRMSRSGITAAELLAGASEEELADLLYHYGEERASRRIARAIVKARAEAPITRTSELAELVAETIGRGGDIHPATRTFQALRIQVNDELGELERALAASERLLAPGGRLVVVVFHSLEDRIVKQFFSSRCGEAPGVSRHLPFAGGAGTRSQALPLFSRTHKKAIVAGDGEIRRNPRARSAKLRWAVRTEARA